MHLRYVDVGDRGAPVLLLLHGHSSRLEELDELAARAAGRFRVVMCDLPGCGYSDHPLIEYSIGLYEEVLWSFLDALGIHSFSVAGGSLGGNLALRLALSRPDRVERAIPWAPVGWWEPEPLLALGARLFLHAPEPLFWVSLRKQAGAWFHPGWEGRDAALADALAYREEVYGPAYHAAYFEIAAEQTETTMRQRAREIRVPTLLMVGEHDSKLGMREGVPILAAEMGAPHVIIAGAAHSIANEKTDEVARHLLAFLAG
ncbi:MAG: alpha/beta hydrolase [Sandaracinaceae bacterium]|nr:alpha/beta hydrolase [Sandaracinaceae bacterium]